MAQAELWWYEIRFPSLLRVIPISNPTRLIFFKILHSITINFPVNSVDLMGGQETGASVTTEGGSLESGLRPSMTTEGSPLETGLPQ